MSKEGLRAILTKEEIVPTSTAQDFLNQAKAVDDVYKQHVRTYIPLQTGSDEASGVTAFAKKFIKQVKEKRSPRGYITADFGYGKTSAGLFVWEQAQENRLIAVPPFSLTRLEDLLDATTGWVAYILGKTAPNFVDNILQIYGSYRDRDLSNIAERYGVTLEQAEQMLADGRLQLEIKPKDIVTFFVQITDVVLEAGFEGLIVIPDELQQYLAPEIKSGKIDPLVPFFEIIGELLSKQGTLAFGFLMIITSKELGVMNDQRGDFIDRTRGNTLDLRTIYDRDFPKRLWYQFAETFEYMSLASTVIDDYTLESLGQIASREDLSNGPRTVVNVFRRVASRVLETEDSVSPYNPIDLINDFIANNIAFDGRKILQGAVNRAITSNIVRGRTQLEEATKLIGAFPNEGADQSVQEYYALRDACAELKRIASPDIVIEVGGRDGSVLALRGLDRARENTDELTLILQEFIRSYEPQASFQIERAVSAFTQLVHTSLFKETDWKVRKSSKPSPRRAEILFTGDFASMRQEFPERYVTVQVLGDYELFSQVEYDAECSLSFIIQRDLDSPRNKRTTWLGDLQVNTEKYTGQFELNLMLPCFDNLARALQEQIRQVVDPEDVDVQMILALHDFLLKQAEKDSISKPLKERIQRAMSVRLLEAARDVLLNPAVGQDFEVVGERLIEVIVYKLIKARYGDEYHTLITYNRWRDRLRDYIAALRQLSNFAEKQGYLAIEDTKDNIASYFGTTSASFDAFQSRFSDLLTIEADFQRGQKGSVKFIRHPLEEAIFTALQNSESSEQVDDKICQSLSKEYVYQGAIELGYRDDEIDYILQIMEARELIEINPDWIIEKARPNIEVDEIKEQISSFQQDVKHLYATTKSPDVEHLHARAHQYHERFQGLDKHQDEVELLILSERIREDNELLDSLLIREVDTLKTMADNLNIEPFSPEYASAITHFVKVAPFTEQVNIVRATHERTLGQWQDVYAQFQEDVKQLQQQIKSITIVRLSEIKQIIDELRETRLNLNNQRRTLVTVVEYLNEWERLSDLYHIIVDSVQKLGKPAIQHGETIQEIEQTIVNDFGNDEQSAFSKISAYYRQLSDVQTRLQQMGDLARNKFNREQNQYRTLLTRYAGIPESKLWQNIYYSSDNTTGVYKNLYDAVINQMTEIMEQFYANIEWLDRQVETLATEERDITELRQMHNRVDERFTELSRTSGREDIRPVAKFEGWIKLFAQANRELDSIRQKLQEAKDSTSESVLSGTEKEIYETLQRESTTSLTRTRRAFEQLTDDEFWSVIKILWERGLITIHINSQ